MKLIINNFPTFIKERTNNFLITSAMTDTDRIHVGVGDSIFDDDGYTNHFESYYYLNGNTRNIIREKTILFYQTKVKKQDTEALGYYSIPVLTNQLLTTQ